jgi:hypothetical protein
MPDDFARVAQWWDVDSYLLSKRLVLLAAQADPELCVEEWATLDGELRQKIYFGMRTIRVLGRELDPVIGR